MDRLRKRFVRSIDWKSGEEIVDNPVLDNGVIADRVTKSGRWVSGKIVVTNKRVVFTPLKLQPFYGGVIYINLDSIESVSVRKETINTVGNHLVNMASRFIRGIDLIPKEALYLRIELPNRYESFLVPRPESVAKSIESVQKTIEKPSESSLSATDSPIQTTLDGLERLDQLREDEVVTEDEFTILKEQLIDGIKSPEEVSNED